MTVKAVQPSRFAVLFLAGICFWTSLAALLPVLPLYVRDSGASEYQVGLVMGAFAIGLLGSRAWLGQLADRNSRKIVLLIGAAVAMTAPLGYIAIAQIPALGLLRAFHGISIAAFATAYSTLVVDLSPLAERGRIIGYMSLVNPLGVAIGPAVGGLLQEQFGYSPVFGLASLLGGASLVCTAQVFDPMWQSEVVTHTSAETDVSFWQRFRNPELQVPTVLLLLVGMAFGTIVAFLPLYLQEQNSSLNPGLFYTAAAIASFTMRLLTGRASDRYGRGPFISASLLCYISAMLCLWRSQTDVGYLLAGVLEGSGGGMLIPAVAALIADRVTAAERGRAFGLCMGGFDLGIAIAGPILGAFAMVMGYRPLFVITGGALIFGLLLFITRGSQTPLQSVRFALGRGPDRYALNANP